MKLTNPIGIFDSGVGGLSIWKEIILLLPNEDTIYLADSKNAPYGEKHKQDIIDLCKKNTELLLEKDCKIIVVACNTATTNAISYLREHYTIPFIGIEPAIKPAALQTNTGAIGILATKGTLSSQLFNSTSQKYTKGISVVEQIGEGLVPLIENNKINSPEMKALLLKYLQPMLKNNIDHLVLGCSHYPFLIPLIKKIIGANITIIDSGEAVAKQTKAVLDKNNLLNVSNTLGKHQIFTNADTKTINILLENFSNNFNASYLKF